MKNNISRLDRTCAQAPALLMASAMALAWTSWAKAADPPPGCSTSAGQTTCVFAYTGEVQTFTVPAGAAPAAFYVYGAQGGAGSVRGGFGGAAYGTMPVSPGTAIQINVGGQGGNAADGGYGGFNGGGLGYSPSGGGGGGSDVRVGTCAATSSCTLSDRLIVAGGGGGGAGIDIVGASYYGGDGGDARGTWGYPQDVTQNGERGYENKGGQGGGYYCPNGSNGGDGGFGYGGAGAHGCAYSGGGGGGGWYGGGGGGSQPVAVVPGYSGGGGSGFIDPIMVRNSFDLGARSGNGLVVVVTPLKPAIAAKSFSKAAAAVGETVTLTFTLSNPNPVPLRVGLTDDYPLALENATSQLRSVCGGTLSSPAGAGYLTFVGGVLPPHGSCTFATNVKGTIDAYVTNTAQPILSAQAPPGNAASASLAIGDVPPTLPPAVTKSFSQATAAVGEPVVLTFTITNPNAYGTLTGVHLADTFPSGLINVSPLGLTEGCNGGQINNQLGAVTLDGGTIPAGASCTYDVSVWGNVQGDLHNVTQAVTAYFVGSGNTADATLKVGTDKANLSPTTAIGFSKSTISVGETATLTFNVSNPNPSNPLTGLSLLDVLPSGLKNLSTDPSPACNGGTISGQSNFYVLDNGTLAGGASCGFAFTIQGTVAGDYVTDVNVTSVEVGPGNLASASIKVLPLVPVANAVSAHVFNDSENTPIVLKITGGAPTSVTVDSTPAHGTASAIGTSISYTPDAGYLGPDSFTYTATNAGGTSSPATISVVVDDRIFSNGME